MGGRLNHWNLGPHAASVSARAEALETDDFVARLWQKDPGLWSADSAVQGMIAGSLGWLDVLTEMESRLAELDAFAEEVRGDGVTDVVHMGMGGSSLAPLVLARALGPQEGWPLLHVLDTTDPATVLQLDESLNLARSLFVEASKSGTTAEPLAFGAYFHQRLVDAVGPRAGEHLVTVTDPGSPLVRESEELGYRRVFLNFPDIGGRYSALSYFGLLPARLMGVDIRGLLRGASVMAAACRRPSVADNPGVSLGAALGELALQGRDKLTLVTPPLIETLGMWLEQLIAESTGKEGTGVLPVAGEPLGDPRAYGDDRVFVSLDLDGHEDAAVDAALDRLGVHHPVIRIRVGTAADLGSEFFRWEIATATIGAVLGINPFDQPNVQESKNITNRLLAEVREAGGLPRREASGSDGALTFYAAPGTEQADTAADGSEALAQMLASVGRGDYVSLQAYLPESVAVDAALAVLRLRLRDGLGVATTVGYGPRFLHSTGQFHKGGPDSGVFLQLTADDPWDAAIPGQPYGFSALKQAQAIGDLEALWKRGRRALRIDLGADPVAGLAAVRTRIDTLVGKGARA